jgi:hypothetical protein
MSVFSSLTNRIFFATALLAVLSITIAIYIVNRAVTRQAERELQRGITEAATVVADEERILFDAFGRDARLIAEMPYLKAAVDTHDPNTVKPIASELLQNQLANADLFVVADQDGRVLARVGTSTLPDDALAAVAPPRLTNTAEISEFLPQEHGILLIRSVPIVPDPHQPEVLGTLVLGASLDERQAAGFKKLTESDIAFGRYVAQARASPRPPRRVVADRSQRGAVLRVHERARARRYARTGRHHRAAVSDRTGPIPAAAPHGADCDGHLRSPARNASELWHRTNRDAPRRSRHIDDARDDREW